jgi:D-alanyl-D-alanine carboxypeptidase
MRISAEALSEPLERLVAAGAPGAAAWVRDESGIRRAARGVADLRTGRPMRPELHFRAGSMTKSLVATVVLQLVGEGALSLADTVGRRLPGILPAAEGVTIRQLLNHTGGVPDYVATAFQALYRSRQGRLRVWTPRELVGLVAGQPPLFPPGTSWRYSNTGYVLLGLMVQATSGRTLAQELAARIFEPLGLVGTSLPDDSARFAGPRARGYSLPQDPDGRVLDGPLLDITVQCPSWAWAAGALVSTLDDLGRFLGALTGGRLLPPALLAEMRTTVAAPPEAVPVPLFERYGLGLAESEVPGGRLVGHSGGIPGFLCTVLSTPDGHRQLGLMINALYAPEPAVAAFLRAYRELGARIVAA